MVAAHQPIPDWAKNEPAIDPCERVYLDAFFDLSSCRSVGMSLGQIPWSAVADYGDRIGLVGEAHRVFVAVVRALDDAFLTEWVPEQKAAPEPVPEPVEA